jgi:hypothetical protein
MGASEYAGGMHPTALISTLDVHQRAFSARR